MTGDREPTNNQIGSGDNSNIGDIGEQAHVAQGSESIAGNFNNANIIIINEASGLIQKSLAQGMPVHQLLNQIINSHLKQFDKQRFSTGESIVDELREPADGSINPELIQLVRLLSKDEKTSVELKGGLDQWLSKVAEAVSYTHLTLPTNREV